MDKKAKTIIGLLTIIMLIVIIAGIFVIAQNNIFKGSPNPFNQKKGHFQKNINFLLLNLINRSFISDTYFDAKEKKYYSIIYANPVNIKNLQGKYEPYENVTNFNFDDNKLILSWNDKLVIFDLYTKDSEGKKEKIKDRSKEQKEKLNFNTTIQKGRGFFYYNHTLNKNEQPSKIGYDIVTENVDCKIDRYKFICDEQIINFEEAVSKQNLNVELKNNYIEFSGEDLSYIDPFITLNVENGTGDWGQVEYKTLLGSYNYDAHDLTRIGAEDNVNDDLIRGWVIFDVDIIDDTANIDDVDLYLHIESSGINTVGCSDSDVDLRFYELDAEDFDETPDTEDEELWMWNNISADTFYGAISSLDSSDQGTTILKDLGPNGEMEVETLVDGIPENEFMIGMKVEPSDEIGGTNCNVDLEDTVGDINLPYIIVIYTIPDIFSPSTSVTATSPPGNSSYTFGNVTNENVQITLSCGDIGSGCKSGYPKYCTDTSNSCSPLISATKVNITSGGINYVRYQSMDNFNNSELIKSKTIIINRNYTQNVSLLVNDVNVWNQSDYFASTETSNDFAEQLNDLLSNCTEDVLGYCAIPLIIHSDSEGKINISNINIYFNITEYLWNVSGLPELSTYKVRVKATDGLLNSSWVESGEDFSIGAIDTTPPNLSIIFPSNNTNTTNNKLDVNYTVFDANLDSCWYSNDSYLTNSSLTCGQNITNIIWSVGQHNITIYANDSEGNEASYSVTFTINIPNDTHKYLIRDNLGNTVAWLGNEGNIVLKGSCFSGGTCNNPGNNSFIIANATDNHVAFINASGDLCLEKGDCSDQSTSCNPTRNAFIIKNSSGYNMSNIDYDGELCLIGRLYINAL